MLSPDKCVAPNHYKVCRFSGTQINKMSLTVKIVGGKVLDIEEDNSEYAAGLKGETIFGM